MDEVFRQTYWQVKTSSKWDPAVLLENGQVTVLQVQVWLREFLRVVQFTNVEFEVESPGAR